MVQIIVYIIIYSMSTKSVVPRDLHMCVQKGTLISAALYMCVCLEMHIHYLACLCVKLSASKINLFWGANCGEKLCCVPQKKRQQQHRDVSGNTS